jgi:hypothetical protein
VEQGHFWEYKPRENQPRRKNEKTLGNLHLGGLYGGAEKGRDPYDLGMGSSLPRRRNTLVTKVSYQMAKGRREEHQDFS